MMQMLASGGMPVLSDGERKADSDNPRGYLEWERIKQLPRDPLCIAEAEGKAVKIISLLLLSLPEGHDYRVIFMQRPLSEVLASQETMMRNRGTTGTAANASVMSAAFEKNLRAVDAWLESKAYVKTLRLPYHEVVSDPKTSAQKIAQFLEMKLDVEAMTRQVDSTLYRNRSN
jgi:Sulfotransferase domain